MRLMITLGSILCLAASAAAVETADNPMVSVVRVLAEAFAHEIVPAATRYQTNPAIYHDARRRILSALDQ